MLQYYKHMEEMEWAASICIGPEGDMHNVSTAECAIRMAKAINHYFDPLVSLDCIKKANLDAASFCSATTGEGLPK